MSSFVGAKSFASVAAALALSFGVSGCSTLDSGPPALYQSMGDIVYGATDQLASRVSTKYIRKNGPVIVTTIVSVDDLSRSSTFGRLSSQLILSKLAARGFLVKDVTYMKGVLDINQQTGELVLSRDARRLSKEYGAQGVVVGTYAVGGDSIYLNMRMLSTADGRVISSASAVIPRDRDTSPLVESATSPAELPAGNSEPYHPLREERG